MAEITMVAEVGRSVGSRSARRLRADGKVPGVIYGHGIDPLPVAVDGRDLRHALTGEAGLNALLSLRVDGATHLTLARAIQRHPVRGTVTHVDFIIVRRDEIVSAEVPVNLVGDATEVHRGDGIVEQQMFSLTVHATPADIPPHIEVDISELAIGTAIRVSDLRLPAGVTTDVDPDEAIVIGQTPVAVALPEEEEAAAPEGEEGAEAAGQAPAEGEAPSAESSGASEG